MKKYLGVTLVVIISILLYFYMNPNPQKVIENYLKNKYKKEFIVEVLGKREKTYEAIIFPKKYVGTPRENDSYYWGRGFAKGRKGGDTYGLVLLNESTNEFFLPKLKELFGENVLPVLDMGPSYVKNNFKEEMEALKKAYKLYPTASFEPISGGIYIFGRVESDKDREWYRKQIYEFVQFMKKTGTFEYVSLWLVVADERVLSDEFVNNKKDKEKLLRLHNENETEFRKQRAEIMKKYSKSYEETAIENIRERTDNILKSDLYDTGGNAIGLARMTYYNELLVTPLYSEKYIKSQSLEDNYKLKDYDKVEDVEFTEEFY